MAILEMKPSPRCVLWPSAWRLIALTTANQSLNRWLASSASPDMRHWRTVKARQLLEAGDWAGVEQAVSGLVTQFKGLPAAPAVEAIGLLADAQLAQKNLDAARGTYQMLGAAYQGTAYAEKSSVGLARLALAEGGNAKLLEAAKRLEPILAASATTLLPDPARQRVFADAWFAQGQLLEAREDKAGALEAYCRVTALYPLNPALVSQAAARVKSLRSDATVFVK